MASEAILIYGIVVQVVLMGFGFGIVRSDHVLTASDSG